MSLPHALWTSMLPADSTFTPDQVAVGAAGHRIEFADGSTRLCATSGLWNVPRLWQPGDRRSSEEGDA